MNSNIYQLIYRYIIQLNESDEFKLDDIDYN